MTTEEGNKLIMVFDGWKLKPVQTFDPEHNTQNPGSNTYYVYEKQGRICRIEDVEFDIVYHQDWNSLMRVVEKIQSIDTTPANYKGYRIEIVVQGYVKIEGFPMPPIFTNVSIEGSLIAAVWKAVVSFIQWFNEQEKTAISK